MTSETPLSDRCGAKCRDGGYCTQYPVGSNDRCRMHGGSSPRGEDSPQFKHGLFSDYLPPEERDTIDALDEFGVGDGSPPAVDVMVERDRPRRRGGAPSRHHRDQVGTYEVSLGGDGDLAHAGGGLSGDDENGQSVLLLQEKPCSIMGSGYGACSSRIQESVPKL